jgi:hypothetical protein
VKRKLLAGLAVAAIVLGSPQLLAQVTPGTATPGAATPGLATPPIPDSASGPAGIPIGPLMVFPGVDFAIGYDDNLFMTPTNRTSSVSSVVSPYAKAELKSGPHVFDAIFSLQHGRYYDSPADTYTDYALGANANLVLSGRARAAIGVQHRRGHDPRGSTDRGVSGEPDVYTNTGITGGFAYGAQGAKGALEFDAGWFQREYQNNRATTAASDRTTANVGGTFLWRIQPKTQLLFNVQHIDTDYDLGTSTQDSTDNRVYVGARWEATALTQGTVKFGRMSKRFGTGSGRQNITDTSWDVGVRWSPLTYSVFDFNTSKLTGESTGVGDAIVGKLYSVLWTHAWNSRLRTQVLGSWKDDQFVGAGSSRKDETGTLGFKVNYQFRRWLKFGLDYTFSDRQSNDPAFNYRKNVILFSVGATL